MTDDLKNKELLSALADGELQGDELAQAIAWAEEDEGHSSWQLYHLVGDVLRSPELAHHSQHDLLTGLRAQLAQEPALQLRSAQLEAVAVQQPATQVASGSEQRDPVANASVFRWKMAAGFASVAAVAAMGWNVVMAPASGGAQWAQAPAERGAQVQSAAASADDSNVIAVASGRGNEVILRDPRLDELLAAHRQFGSKAALQMPAEFLRNASFGNAAGAPQAGR